jgi:TetR/AcrR family transcriptional regulator, repressor for neighboring sulfatase
MAQEVGEQASSETTVTARPVGRQEVIDATIRAASELFAERQPSQVSVREIAAKAGVSHALVHRYLGSKEDIFSATLAYDREEAAQYWTTSHGFGRTPQTFTDDLPPGRFLKTIMRAALDGTDLSQHEITFPHVGAMSAYVAENPVQAASADERGFDPRLLLSAIIAMAGGMAIAEDFFLAQTGLQDADRDELRVELNRLIGHMMSLAEKPRS